MDAPQCGGQCQSVRCGSVARLTEKKSLEDFPAARFELTPCASPSKEAAPLLFELRWLSEKSWLRWFIEDFVQNKMNTEHCHCKPAGIFQPHLFEIYQTLSGQFRDTLHVACVFVQHCCLGNTIINFDTWHRLTTLYGAGMGGDDDDIHFSLSCCRLGTVKILLIFLFNLIRNKFSNEM